MYIVIAGLSDIGKNLAELLFKERNEVLVIDRDPARCAEIAEGSDIMVITGDAGQKSTLEEARVRNAHAFVAAAGDDSENLMLCMVAKEIGVKTVISLVDDAEHTETFRQAGINLQVNPDIVAAKHIYRMISHPYVKDYLSLESAEIFEIEVEEDMKCVGKWVSKLATPNGVKVLVVQREGKYLLLDTEIKPKDWLTLIVTRESAKQGTEFMNRWFVKG
ncbi:MAG: TrkA family potassium uptake protein [Dehalococcoidia bacterium]|nr:MAG: TrkA family potassium uptake protein [Dehalococcoidia bacterium]TEU17583.1 MAG: TrkA family potassium uptake protein [Dehalococcoidia bacterium]